jgi:hypothetical protein
VVRCDHCRAPLAPGEVATTRPGHPSAPANGDSRMTSAKKGAGARSLVRRPLAPPRPDPSVSPVPPRRRADHSSRRPRP